MSNLSFISRLIKTKFVIALLLLTNAIWALDSDPNATLQKYFIFASNKLDLKGTATTPSSGYWGAGGDMTQTGFDQVIFNTEIRVKGNFYGGNINATDVEKKYYDTVRVKGTPSGKTPPLLQNPGVFSDPTLPTWTAAQILASIGGTNGVNKNYGWTTTTTTLAPGKYGSLIFNDPTSKITLGAGDYYFTDVTFGGTIEIDNNGTTPTRIIIQGNLTMQNTGASPPKILAKTSASLGKTLVYVAGTTVDIQPGSGAQYTQVDASVIAPFATVTIMSEVKFNGQVAAQNINIANNFDGGASTFIPFDPAGFKLVGASSINVREDNDLNQLTNNTRLIKLPIQLSTPTTEAGSVQYIIRPLTTGASWTVGKTSASVGNDTTGNDIALSPISGSYTLGTKTASKISGTLNFNVGASFPTDSIMLFVNDDRIPEPDAGGTEYFEIKFFNPVKLKFEQGGGEVFFHEIDSLIYVLKVESDDALPAAATAITLSKDTVNENAATSTVVGILTNNDPDGSSQSYTYTLNTAGTPFVIVGDTLKVNGTLDYEVKNTYTINVTVTDNGAPSASFSQDLVIKIRNLNDEYPLAMNDAATVLEGGTVTLTNITANDVDANVAPVKSDNLPLTGTISLLGSGTNGSFAIRPNNSVEYTHNGSENYADSIRYVLNDGGASPRNLDTAWIRIDVTPVEDQNPVLASDSILAPEGGDTNSTKTGVQDLRLLVTDADSNGIVKNGVNPWRNSIKIFVKTAPKNGTFNVFTNGTFNYVHNGSETLKDSVELYAQDQANLQSVAKWFYIRILPLNNQAPVPNTKNDTIAENAAIGTKITWLNSVSDLDMANPVVNDFTYAIVGGDGQNVFSIDGTDKTKLVLKDAAAQAAIDQDVASPKTSFTVNIEVSDGVNKTTTAVQVYIKEVDEFNPILSDASTSVNEGVVNLKLFDLNGSDQDINQVKTYTLLNKGNDYSKYSIVSGNQVWLGATALDYETKTADTIFVTLTTGAKVDTARLIVNVGNIADGLITKKSLGTITVVENTASGSVVLSKLDTLASTSGVGEVIEYTLAGTDANLFAIDVANKQIKILEKPDYEIKTKYSTDLRIIFTSKLGNNIGAKDSVSFLVTIDPQNDNGPAASNQSFTVSEGKGPMQIGTVVATDADILLGTGLTFSLKNLVDQNRFIIAANGVLSVKSGDSLNYENTLDRQIQIPVIIGNDIAYQTGSNAANKEIIVTINVTDVDENAPVFGTVTMDSVYENLSTGYKVATLNVSDVDGDPITIATPDSRFEFKNTSQTGANLTSELWLKSGTTLNYESTPTVTVKINTSSRNSSGSTVAGESRDLVVVVRDTNEVPVFTNKNANDGTEDVQWTYDLAATDVDAKDQGQLAYSILSGPANLQLVGSQLQWTPTNSDLNNNATSTSFTVKVLVKDKGWDNQGELKDTLTLSFNVSSVNSKPVVKFPILEIHEDENLFTTLSSYVTDEESNTFTFALANPTTTYGGATFTLASSGAISWTPKDERTTEWMVRIPVTVRDPDNGVTTDTLFIKVYPVNDKPVLTLRDTSVFEKTKLSIRLDQYMKDTDPVGDQYTYELLNSVLGANIANSSNSQAILDWTAGSNTSKTPFNQTFIIKVWDRSAIQAPHHTADSASQFTIDTITVKVIPVNDAPTITMPKDTAIDEDTQLELKGILVGDEDIANLDLLNVFGTSSDILKIRNSEIIMLSQTGSNRSSLITPVKNANGLVTLTYFVKDDSTRAVYPKGTINILIRPVNDVPDAKDTLFKIAENPKLGDLVGKVVATDVDGDKLSYSLVSSGQIFAVDVNGQVLVKDPAKVDYENLKFDTLRVRISDGGLDTTINVIVEIQNVIEKSSLDITFVKAINDTNQKWTSQRDNTLDVIRFDPTQTYSKDGVDTLWTNQATLNVRLVKDDGTILDTTVVISKQLITDKSGTQEVIFVYRNPTKDASFPDTIRFIVGYNTVNPKVSIEPDYKLPVDKNGVLYVNASVWNTTKGKLNWNIEEMNTSMKKSSRDTLVNLNNVLEEGQIKLVKVTYTDVFGNEVTDTLRMILDTKAPAVAIVAPRDPKGGDTVQLFSLYISNFDWKVDGSLQDSLTKQTLIMGMNTVTRSSCDFAGNCGLDTIWVDAVVEDTRIQVGVKDDLITSSTDQQEKKYYEDRAGARSSVDPTYKYGVPETEGYNLSLTTNNGKMEEIFYYTGTNHKKIAPNDRASLDTSSAHIGPVIAMDFQFPVLDDSSGTCGDGKPMWKLMVNSIQVNIYDQIGQFVSNVSVPEFEIDKLSYQQDDGKVNALLEIPKVRNEMRSLEGRRWGDGVYLMNVRVKTSALPINCGLDPANKLSPNVARISKMTKVGYSRVK